MPDPDLILHSRIAQIHHALAGQYGLPAWESAGEPIGMLIQAFLGQHTSDINSGRAFQALIEAYPDWPAVMKAPTEELTEVIRSGGLANQKAPRIQRALQHVYAELGHFDLAFLRDLPVAEARSWLAQLPGIGNKSASVLLLFCFNRPAFPVDTHVHRVTRRLGLAPAAASPDQVMHLVESHTPAAWFYPLHINFIRHGRAICKAQRPHCGVCVLAERCDWRRRSAGELPGEPVLEVSEAGEEA